MKTEWELSVCPVCGQEKPEIEEGPMDFTEADEERDEEGYVVCTGDEEHEPTRYETIKVVSAASTEAQRKALEMLADRKRWSDSNTGAVNWLHLDGHTKPYEIAERALGRDDDPDAQKGKDDHPSS